MELGKKDKEIVPADTKPEEVAEVASERRKKIVAEIALYQQTIREYFENNKKYYAVSEPKHYKFIIPFDLKGYKEETNDLDGTFYSRTYKMGGLVEGIDDTIAPSVIVKIFIDGTEKALAEKTLGGEHEGFVYRRAKPVRIIVLLKNSEIGSFNSIDEYFKLPQISKFYLAPAKVKHSPKEKRI